MLAIIKKSLIVSVWLFTATIAFGQPLSYTQYMNNLTPINANYSLFNAVGGSVNSMVRKQWAGVPGSPTNYMVNADMPIPSVNGSAGIILRNDVFAIEHQTSFNAFFAKAIQLNDKQNLAVSMSAGLRNYVANYSSVDASDPVFKNNISETKPNIGFGVMYYTNIYYVGLSVPEISIRSLGTASQQDETNFRNNYYLTGGYQDDLNSSFKIKYAALIGYSRGSTVIADISSLVTLKNIVGLGLNYRTGNEAAVIVSVNYNEFAFGYSYQFGLTNSNIGGLNNATHEFTLAYRFGKVDKQLW